MLVRSELVKGGASGGQEHGVARLREDDGEVEGEPEDIYAMDDGEDGGSVIGLPTYEVGEEEIDEIDDIDDDLDVLNVIERSGGGGGSF